MADNQKHAINWRAIWKVIKAIFSFTFKIIWVLFSYTMCFITTWIIIGFILVIYTLIQGNINFQLWLGIVELTYLLTTLFILIFPEKWLKFFNTYIREKKKDPRY